MIPFRTPFFLPYLYPSLTWRIPTIKNELYLTFDDGPVPGPTDFVLETLNNSSSAATFFCIGDNIRKHPDVFRKILAAGHTVANHTFNHLNGWETPVPAYLENIDQCEQEIKKYFRTEKRKLLFRPPYGRVSLQEITFLNNYQIVMWDVLTKDFNSSISPEQCLKKSIAATRKGSIVVFHDSIKAERNLYFVLPRYIEYFREKGFEFKPFPQ